MTWQHKLNSIFLALLQEGNFKNKKQNIPHHFEWSNPISSQFVPCSNSVSSNKLPWNPSSSLFLKVVRRLPCKEIKESALRRVLTQKGCNLITLTLSQAVQNVIFSATAEKCSKTCTLAKFEHTRVPLFIILLSIYWDPNCRCRFLLGVCTHSSNVSERLKLPHNIKKIYRHKHKAPPSPAMQGVYCSAVKWFPCLLNNNDGSRWKC